MLMRKFFMLQKLLRPQCSGCYNVFPRVDFSQSLESKYTEEQRDKILKIVNDANIETLSSYDITKGRLKKFSNWKSNNNNISSLSDLELVDGFTHKIITKLCDSIIEDSSKKKDDNSKNKIKGQFLHPNMIEAVIKNIQTAGAVYVSVNSICWTLINKRDYEVLQWQYFGLDHPEGKKFQMTDIFDLAWRVTRNIPEASVYVMKAEATTLRAAGSDPNNPKVIAVNLQKSQLVAMIVALLNARALSKVQQEEQEHFTQNVYFLRPTLPYRLYGTLIGSEKVSTDQTIETLLRNMKSKSVDCSDVYISEELKNMFRNQKELQKDMLGHCLLLGLTFMDLCIYKNQARLNSLLRNSG